MKHRLGVLVIGAGALTLAVLGIPAAASTAGAHVSDQTSSGSAHTFTLTPSGNTVKVVGTTKWTPTGGAGPSGQQAPPGTTYKLTSAAVRAATPRIPDVGLTPHTPYGVVPRTPIAGNARFVNRTGNRSSGLDRAPGPDTSSPATVAGATSSLVSKAGIDAYDQGVLHPVYKTGSPQPLPGVDVEPPDQGLCSGNGYVMEVNNMVMQVFPSSTMRPISYHGMALERLFDTPEVFGGGGTGTYSIGGDPRCYYDPKSGRWFASEIFLTEVDGSSTFGWAGEFVAVSESSVPTGSWHVYYIPDQFDANGVDKCNNLPPATLPTATNPTGPANPCYGDQPLLGVNGNAVFIAINEYALAGNHPLGGVATEYVLSKSDLTHGIASPIYWGHLGDTVARPGAGKCPFNTPAYGEPTAVICPWYSIVPAVSDGAYITTTHGVFYAVSNVTFTTSGGHQLALWKFTNTKAVTNGGAHVTGSVVVATSVPYTEPPANTVDGNYPHPESVVPQKLGPHPLGTLWKTLFGTTPIKWPTGEGMVQANTDRVTTAAYDPAYGSVWAALNSGADVGGQSEADITWFRATPSGSGRSLSLSRVTSGSLAAAGVNDFFPSISFTNWGAGLMDYALVGSQMFPSTGYSFMKESGPTSTMHVARSGTGPTDGFSEYTPTYNRPRWGDYSTAVATGRTFFFAAEMVNQRCTVSQFEATFTCGGTRDIEANWGTSVNRITSP